MSNERLKFTGKMKTVDISGKTLTPAEQRERTIAELRSIVDQYHCHTFTSAGHKWQPPGRYMMADPINEAIRLLEGKS